MAGYIGSKASVINSGVENKKVITATAGQTSFTGLTYSPNRVHVFQNGVRLVDGTDYTATNGTSLTLTVGALVNDQVVVVSYSGFQTSDTVSASAGGTFTGDVNFTGAFTSQGIDDNATSTAMTLDGSGNLLVGHANRNTTVTNGASGATIGYDGFMGSSRLGSLGEVMVLNREDSDGSILSFRKDGSTVGSIGSHSGYITLGNGDTSLIFDSTANSIEPFNQNDRTAEDAAITLGWSSNRFKDLYLSGGVYLGGTGSANKLYDYEQGAFTVGFSGATISATNTTAYYTKIGQLVHWNYYSGASNISGASGNAIITGLPYTVLNNVNAYEPCVTTHNTFFGGSATAGVSGFQNVGTTQATFVSTGGTAGTSFVNGSSKYLMVSGNYLTAS